MLHIRNQFEESDNIGPIDLHIEIFARPNPLEPDSKQQHLFTVCMVNRSNSGDYHFDNLCVFQSGFTVRITSPNEEDRILPYPESKLTNLDREELSIALLYRNFQTYAIGHGCAANWGEKNSEGNVIVVFAESIPVFEAPSTTPDIVDNNGNTIKVAMASLAGLVPDNDGLGQLEHVIDLYENWIATKRQSIPEIPTHLQEIAAAHLDECEECISRMRSGMAYLQSDQQALTAFQLANHAVLLQQLTERHRRSLKLNAKTSEIEFSRTYQEPDVENIPMGLGQWRAFQIAFLLMSLQSTGEEHNEERKIVELIWFPTGGGKTEAYLGLTAFSLFLRRIRNSKDVGVHVLTRYTLRLLTAQQFQRAMKLICAMEYLRAQKHKELLGDTRFSIGIWVGSSNTPNTRTQAKVALKKLEERAKAQNKFILNQCPWCGAEMGPIKSVAKRRNFGRKVEVHGYYRNGNTISYRCSDTLCRFGRSGLPVYSIDEDIYENRPSIVIGTVDKFAVLTWKPEARALFGINSEGEREYSPPGLIIQDELHLISGPLGSMVGLYEAVIEELCTDRRTEPPTYPKIVSSTATIRRYKDQIKALYGREQVALFPPSGIDADDSFFARYARDEDGTLSPGRMYVGVHGPGLGSMQTTQVRSFTSLLQSPMSIHDKNNRDPWWSLLIFFNSLRELGTTLSLLQSDIPDYLKITRRRLGIPFSDMRKLRVPCELTGRLRSDEVPETLAKLELAYNQNRGKNPIDVCLASSILEVGVDVDRLSLMAVVGQPKSTSQYIQVSGRVGRRWWERPGLVVTLYSASKPRDRSHFEKFCSYHERLYAQVEPTSVTPFSPPALDRALHAIMVMYVRQFSDLSYAKSTPYPYPDQLIGDLRKILLQRVKNINETECENFKRVFDDRAEKQWKAWEKTKWSKQNSTDSFLLFRSGEYIEPENRFTSWPTPNSMRNVDAQCEAAITTLYIRDKSDGG